MTGAEPQFQFESLTAREREIFRLVAQHLRDKEIARLLELSPRTVHMHVLKGRRRLAGLSRRDAALAFVAWEEKGYGSEYHKQSPDLAAAPSNRSPDPHSEDRNERFDDIPSNGLLGELAGSGGSPGHDFEFSGTGAPGAGDRQRPAQSAGAGRYPVAAPVEGALRGGLRRGWLGGCRGYFERRRHDLTSLQWLALIGTTAGISALLIATVMSAAHNFLYAIHRMREGWPLPPP